MSLHGESSRESNAHHDYLALIAALAVVFTVGVGIGICAVVGGHFILGWAIDRYARREPQ